MSWWTDGTRPLTRVANSVVDWYRSPSKNSTDYFLHQFAKGIPFIGGALDASDNQARMEDYLRNRGLSWMDVRYNSAPFGRSLGQATANANASILSLYRNSYRDMQRGRENARKERFNQYYKAQMLKHRQVQTAWYRNHMRYRFVSSQAHRGGRPPPPCEALSLVTGQQLAQPP